jgi:putative tryptophan/tyrosine transport system substrate-binding protein
MNRRDTVLGLLAFGAALRPLRAHAQRVAGKPARLGFLANLGPAGGKPWIDCFRSGLRDLGWIEGKDINIEYRWGEGLSERFPAMAAELVRLQPDLIVSQSTPATQAAQRATQTIPIVMIGVSDPVASKFVASLARPGGNITGVSNFLPATSGKLLELLKKVVPGLSRVGVLHNPTNSGKLIEVQELRATAAVLGVTIQPLEVRSSIDFDSAFTRAVEFKCDALIILQEGLTFANTSRILEFAAKTRVPAIYQIREFVEAGGLMSYGLNFCQHFKHAATHVDKILKGAYPGNLPVELPTTFELVVNLKTAKSMGLSIPQLLLISADALIE